MEGVSSTLFCLARRGICVLWLYVCWELLCVCTLLVL